jgi:hypothetical protein
MLKIIPIGRLHNFDEKTFRRQNRQLGGHGVDARNGHVGAIGTPGGGRVSIGCTSQTGPWRYSDGVQGWQTFQPGTALAVGPALARGSGAPGRKQSPCPRGLDERFGPHPSAFVRRV